MATPAESLDKKKISSVTMSVTELISIESERNRVRFYSLIILTLPHLRPQPRNELLPIYPKRVWHLLQICQES